MFTREFKDIGKSDVGIAGGKGASLGEMTQAGIPVPNGFVVLSDAFEKFIDETGLRVRIQAILDKVKVEEVHTIENASEEIKAMIMSSNAPPEITSEIKKSFKKLGARFVAVRSSATSEDSSSAAWAGQLDTFLNTTEKNLIENVKQCWASLFTPRAIFYRFEQKLDKKQISVAVVVQKMIQSEESGIAFSVHPLTQDYNQIIIEAGLGLGEAIVSGQITPDSYVIQKSDLKIVEIKINEQEKGLFKSSEGGNEWRKLGERGKKQVLSEKGIRELAEIIIKIENHYGFPCDIEWARGNGIFYITQSRPITTLTENRNNNEIDYKSSNYIRMFETTRMPFLINTIALEHYESLKAMSILRNNLWTTYLPKESEKKTLKEGIKLFESESLFKEYQAEFEAYKKRSIVFFDSLLKKDKPSKDEVKEYFSLIAELWKYYQKTEFFYVDDAFRKSKDNKIITNNLRKLEEIKNSGREHLNKLIFGSNSYLNKILFIVSKQFDLSIEDLMFYSKEEIYNLFDKKKVEERILTQRKESYVFYSKNNKLAILQGNSAIGFIKGFLVEEGIKEIKGTSANRGKVIGRARVLFYGPETFDKIPEMIRNMNQGEILVTETTSPEIITACKKASAILTNQGGLLSHAAIVSRELGIPCVVGLGNITHIVKDGDLVEVKANHGTVRIIERAEESKKKDNLKEFKGKKKIFEELVQLNGPLGLGEIHYKKEAAREVPWANEKFEISPYIFYEKRGEAIHFYYDPKGIRWQIEQAGKYPDEKGAIKLIKEGYDRVKRIIDSEKALGRSEFLKFIKDVEEIWPWFNYMWWAIHYKEEKGESIEELMKIRKYTEYFTPGFIAVFRKSVVKIYPEKNNLQMLFFVQKYWRIRFQAMKN